MIKNVIIVMLIVLCVVSFTYAENMFPATNKNVNNWTGHEWENFNEEQKAYYMAGFLSATSYYIGQFSDNEINVESNIILEIVKDIDNYYKNNDLNIPITEAAE